MSYLKNRGKWANFQSAVGNRATSAGIANTNTQAIYPPTAKRITGEVYLFAYASNYGVTCSFYTGLTSNTNKAYWFRDSSNTAQTVRRKTDSFSISLESVWWIRNYFAYYSDTNFTEVALDNNPNITVSEWEI